MKKKFSPFGFTQIELAVALCIFGIVVMLPLQMMVGQNEKEEALDPLSEFESIEKVAIRQAYQYLSPMFKGGCKGPKFAWIWDDGSDKWDSETPGLEFQMLDRDHFYLLGAPPYADEEYKKLIERCQTYRTYYPVITPPLEKYEGVSALHLCVVVRPHRCFAEDDSRVSKSFDEFIEMAPLVFEFNLSIGGRGKGEAYKCEELAEGWPAGSIGMLGHRMIWSPKAYSKQSLYETIDKGGVYVEPL